MTGSSSIRCLKSKEDLLQPHASRKEEQTAVQIQEGTAEVITQYHTQERIHEQFVEQAGICFATDQRRNGCAVSASRAGATKKPGAYGRCAPSRVS